MDQIERQRESAGDSSDAIHRTVLEAAQPRRGLSWLDIGCGTGDVLRLVAERYEPTSLAGIDIIDWLADDLRDRVAMHVGPAEETARTIEPVDRVLLVETMEHLEAPWAVLRAAASAVRPGGVLVLSTPNIATLRHRLELLTTGRLTSFRPDNAPHLQPVLPHVAARVLADEGLEPGPLRYAHPDMLPKAPGRLWPAWAARRWPRLACISVIVTASLPRS
ncbi:MAG TPA: class I SAM-dependent methyltransferase [Baekduia sp.]|nr:class I SAM-dependent methyltransferase [Baekduia sp.]